MIIRESISFERGQEPKAAMELGRYSTIAEITYAPDASSIDICVNDERKTYYIGSKMDSEKIWKEIHKIAWDMGAGKIHDPESDPEEWIITEEWIAESLNFERGKNIRDALELGRKVILKLRNGYRIEGFLRNKKDAEYLIRQINFDMKESYEEAGDDGQTEAIAMEKQDNVFYKYEKQLEDIGFKLVDE